MAGFVGWYEVSDLGRVRRIQKPAGGECCRILRPTPGTGGYLLVHLRAEGQNKTAKVHQLVAVAFIGEPPPGKEVNHEDGDKNNCAASNLEYLTHLENMRHALARGLNRIPARDAGGLFVSPVSP